MAHIVAEPCFDCKYTDCVVVCPVDCFYEGAQMLYIHPEECIDCEACVPECPVEAIFHEDNLPDEWKEFTALNAEESSQVPGHHRKERRSRERKLRSVAEEKVSGSFVVRCDDRPTGRAGASLRDAKATSDAIKPRRSGPGFFVALVESWSISRKTKRAASFSGSRPLSVVTIVGERSWSVSFCLS